MRRKQVKRGHIGMYLEMWSFDLFVAFLFLFTFFHFLSAKIDKGGGGAIRSGEGQISQKE